MQPLRPRAGFELLPSADSEQATLLGRIPGGVRFFRVAPIKSRMGKGLCIAACAAVLAGLAAGPAGATKAHSAAECPPGATNTDYCEIVSIAISPKMSLVAGQKLQTALKKGLNVKVSCDTACVITVTVTFPPSPNGSSALVTKAMVVGTGKGKLSHRGSTVVRVKFTQKGKKQLSKVKSKQVKLGLFVKAVSPDGKSAQTQKNVSLKNR